MQHLAPFVVDELNKRGYTAIRYPTAVTTTDIVSRKVSAAISNKVDLYLALHSDAGAPHS